MPTDGSSPREAAAAGRAAARRWTGASWRAANRFADRASGIADRLGSGVGSRSRRDALLTFAVVTYLSLHTARSALDDAIRKINPAGEAGVGVNSLHDGADAVRHALHVWDAGAQRLELFLRQDPITLAVVQTVLELLLVPFSAGILFVAANGLRRGAVADRVGPGAAAERGILTITIVGTTLYLLLGLFNQLAELAILATREPVVILTPILERTGPLRLGLLVLIVAPLLIVAIRRTWNTSGTSPTWVGDITAYRTVLLVAALHAVLLLVSIPGKQAQDALRLWAVRPALGFWGLAATALLALSLGLFATRIGATVVQARVVLGRDGTEALIGAGIASTLAGVIARLVGFALGPVLLALGTVVGLTGLLSLPVLRGASQIRRPPPRQPSTGARTVVPAVLVVSPFVVLTVALIRAAIPSLLDRSNEVEEATHVHLLLWAAIAATLAVTAFPITRSIASKEVARRSGVRAARTAELRADAAPATTVASEEPRDDDRLDEPPRSFVQDRFFPATVLFLVAVAAAAVWIGVDPVDHAPRLGVVTIMSLFLVLLVGFFGALAIRFDGRALPAALDFVGFRKLPVVLGVIAVALVSQRLAPAGYHDVDTIDASTPSTSSQLTAERAFDRWLADTDAEDEAVPLVFVTAAGGGIKAAAFTATVIDCVFAPTGRTTVEPDIADADGAGTADDGDLYLPDDSSDDDTRCADENRWRDVFVASGASGGSVGIASVLAETSLPDPTPQWVSQRLGKDLLSPSMAWQLLVEVPNVVAAFNPDRDRAAVLEATWREQFGVDAATLPFYADRTGDGWDGPIAYFSGTNLADGCRVNVSAVRAATVSPSVGPPEPFGSTIDGECTARRIASDDELRLADQGDTHDLADYLCGENVDLATAAFLSARFPYVSPAGTATCDGETISVGDGGYRDNSGASTVSELWSVLAPIVARHNASGGPCIVPIWLEIGTGYAGFQGEGAAVDTSQILAPLMGASAVFGDLSFGAVEQLAAEFTRPLAADLEAQIDGRPITRHLRVSLVDHPGVTAPLGWSLSPAAVEDFEQQLQVNENQRVINALDGILDGGTLACVPAGD